MNLFSLLILVLVQINFVFCNFKSVEDLFPEFLNGSNSINTNEGVTSSDLEERLDDYRRLSEKMLADFISSNKVGLSEDGVKNRNKRRISGYRPNDKESLGYLNDQTGVYRLQNIYPVSKLCSFGKQLLHFNTIQVNQSTLTVCLTETHLVIGKLINLNFDSKQNDYNDKIIWSILSEYNGYGFRKVDNFFSNKQIYFIIAKSGVGMPLLKLDLNSFDLILQDQQTMSTNPTTTTVWRPKTWKPNHQSAKHLISGETWNMAVANTYSNFDPNFDKRKKRSLDKIADENMKSHSKRELDDSGVELISNVVEQKKNDQNRLNSFKSYVSLFYFDSVSNYFDEYDKIPSYFVKDICPFTINNYDYMAVINFKAGINNHKVSSEIFKFDLQEGKWKSIQKIVTYGAVSCEFFKFKDKRTNEEEYFLAIANNHDVEQNNVISYEVKSVIYKFFYDQFVPFQCLKTVGASSVQMIRKKNIDNYNMANNEKKFKTFNNEDEDELVLAVATLNGVQLYQYNGWKFFLSKVQYISQSMGPSKNLMPTYLNSQSSDLNKIIDSYLVDSNLLYSFELNNKLYLLASNRRYLHDLNCFRLVFTFENALGQWYLNSKNWCQGLVEKLTKENTQIFSHLSKELEKTFYIDQKEPIIIDNLELLHKVSIIKLRSPAVQDIFHKKIYSNQFVYNLIDIGKRLSELNANDKKVAHYMDRTLKLKSSKTQDILASFKFETLSFNCLQQLNCIINNINSNQINKYDLTNLGKRIIRINQPENIFVPEITFEKMILTNHLILNGKLNRNLNLKDFITKSTRFIEKPILFKGNVYTTRMKVNFTNGLLLNHNTVFLKNTNQKLTSELIFNSPVIIAGNLMVDGTFNKMSKTMNQMIDSVITKYSTSKIISKKYFVKGLFSKNLLMSDTSTCNGINLVNMYDNLFWINQNIIINSKINFTNIIVKGNLYVKGLINNIRVPNNDLVLANQKNIISGKKIFNSNLFINNLYLNRSLNNVPIVANKLDIFMRNIPQRIYGYRVFKSNVHSNKNIHINEFVNNFKLYDLKRNLEAATQKKYFKDTVVINGNVTFESNLIVDNLINGANLNYLIQNGLKLNEPLIKGFGKFYLSSVLTPHLKCNFINGLDVENDFLFKNGFQVITGSKLFYNNVYARHLNINFFNQVDIRKDTILKNYLLKSTTQYISGHKLIKGDVYVDNLIVSNLNGKNMKNLFKLHEDGYLSGKINFGNLNLDSNLIANNVVKLNYVNNIDVNNLISSSLLYDFPQTITGFKNVLKLFIPKTADFKVKVLNNIILSDYFASIVYRNKPGQVVKGIKVFIDDIRMNDVKFTHSWDKISPSQFKNSFVYKNGDQKIYGNLILTNVLFERGLDLKKKFINNYPVSWLNSTIVRVDMPVDFKNKIKFNNVVLYNNMNILGKVSGLNLRKDFIFADVTKQFIYSAKSFKNVVVNHHLALKSGYINNLDVNSLCLNTVRKNMNSSVLISAPTTILGDLNVNEFSINNQINGLNILSWKQNSILDYNSDKLTVIRGQKHFNTLILDGPSQIVSRLFSGISLMKLSKSYMSLSRPQKVFSNLHFTNNVKFRNLVVRGNLDTDSVNNINLKDLNKNSLKVVDDQVIKTNLVFTGKVDFANDIVIAKDLLNRIKLNQDLLLKTRPMNIIYSKKKFVGGASFEEITTSNKLLEKSELREANTGINFNLRSFLDSAVFNNDKYYIISGIKTFNYIKVNDLVVNGLLNGFPFNVMNLIINKPGVKHIIRGNYVFNEEILLDSSLTVSGLINYYNLKDFVHDLVMKNAYENVITSDKVIKGELTVNNLHVMNTIHGYDLKNVSNKIYGDKFNYMYEKKNLFTGTTNLNRLQRNLEAN